ncbi:iron dicitrate transport regulator FecR [Oxalobacteraceae bacterium OM1]|nr:iron dicitrate transport regulator FecR [Oxalobacteraceae bacterium OM1]
MSLPRKCIATKALAALVLWGAAALSWAGQLAGTVVNVSGPLLAKKADGTVKALAVKSSVEQGDTLVTEKDTYARIKFTDNSEVTLKPNTQFKVEAFDFEDDKPAGDKAEFSLVKGGLRAVTGTLGKRNKEKVGFNTPTATIGIRGTTFVAVYVPPSGPPGERIGDRIVPEPPASTAQGKAPASGSGSDVSGSKTPAGVPGLAPGLHLQVTDGAIVVTNNGGAQGFQAGQFGYVPGVNQAPVIVPANPGLQFVPPPSFNVGAGPSTAGNGQGSAVDCEVR